MNDMSLEKQLSQELGRVEHAAEVDLKLLFDIERFYLMHIFGVIGRTKYPTVYVKLYVLIQVGFMCFFAYCATSSHVNGWLFLSLIVGALQTIVVWQSLAVVDHTGKMVPTGANIWLMYVLPVSMLSTIAFGFMMYAMRNCYRQDLDAQVCYQYDSRLSSATLLGITMPANFNVCPFQHWVHNLGFLLVSVAHYTAFLVMVTIITGWAVEVRRDNSRRSAALDNMMVDYYKDDSDNSAVPTKVKDASARSKVRS